MLHTSAGSMARACILVQHVPIMLTGWSLCVCVPPAVLPLTKQLSVVSGSLWSKTLQGARAQRIEMLLLHEFHDRKFILPDKLTARDKAAQVAAQASKNAAKGKGAKGKKAGAKAAAGDADAAGGEDEVRASLSSDERRAARNRRVRLLIRLRVASVHNMIISTACSLMACCGSLSVGLAV